jgi:hypothetical protein
MIVHGHVHVPIDTDEPIEGLAFVGLVAVCNLVSESVCEVVAE